LEVQLQLSIKTLEGKCSLRNPELQVTIEFENVRRKFPCKTLSKITIQLESLGFLMDTSNCIEHSKKQKDIVNRKEMKEEEGGNESSSTYSSNSGSTPHYQIHINRLDGPLCEGNILWSNSEGFQTG
jgi:hypothetical protein